LQDKSLGRNLETAYRCFAEWSVSVVGPIDCSWGRSAVLSGVSHDPTR